MSNQNDPMKNEHPSVLTPVPNSEPTEAARSAGLRYVTDAMRGITREAAGDGFRYLDADGKPIDDEATLARIRSLAIPPAWTDVWICKLANGHLQATGRDAKKRKQYRYHPRWRSVRDDVKYERMLSFGKALPQIRRPVDAALSLPGLPREKVLATIVELLEVTMMRIGNEEYARTNKSFGLTTLRARHVNVDGKAVEFRFRGKSGVFHAIKLEDRRLARIIARVRELPGQELFQYLDDAGATHTVGSADVNDYLRAITGEDYTAKDFRTWSGTVLAALALQDFEQFDSETQARKNIVRAIESVAAKLGNTPTICRKCYVHPAVIDAYLDGTIMAALRAPVGELHHLSPQEAAVLALLQQGLRDGPAAPPKRARQQSGAVTTAGRPSGSSDAAGERPTGGRQLEYSDHFPNLAKETIMSPAVQAIPQGMHTITPHLTCAGAADAIEFYKKAFGAVEGGRMPGPDGKIMHAQIKIGDSTVMLVDEFPEWGNKGPKMLNGTPVTIHMYLPDADAVFKRAVEAGATVKMEMADAFWGDRYGVLIDPFGHQWSLATHIKDMTPEEMAQAMKSTMG